MFDTTPHRVLRRWRKTRVAAVAAQLCHSPSCPKGVNGDTNLQLGLQNFDGLGQIEPSIERRSVPADRFDRSISRGIRCVSVGNDFLRSGS
jgi:hypothetical protein